MCTYRYRYKVIVGRISGFKMDNNRIGQHLSATYLHLPGASEDADAQNLKHNRF